MSFDAEITDLRSSAEAARAAADQAATVDPGTALRGAAAGLPGSRAAGAIARVAARWTSEQSHWVEQARGYAADLDRAATTYTRSDRAARDAFLQARQRPQ